VLVALGLPIVPVLEAEAGRRKGKTAGIRKRRKGKAKGKGKKNPSGRLQTSTCFPRTTACQVGRMKNGSGCDFAGSTAFAPNKDLWKFNGSNANFRGVNFNGANLSDANLSSACLVEANLTGANLTRTNLGHAIRCRTVMPNGEIDDSGCGSATSCCPTCSEPGKACGTGIGGGCCGNAICAGGVCAGCPAVTPHRCSDGVCRACCANTDCDDDNACTRDFCDPSTGLCVHEEIDCDDGINCTLDSCHPELGCVHTPSDDLCETDDPCFTPRCTPTGCVTEPKDCDDGNPCTIDTCVAGECRHQPHNICNDGLRCTRDVCVPDAVDRTRFTCESIVDPSLCGPVASCQQALCVAGRDCTIVSFDDRCPASDISCLAPHCTNNGCGFRDTCTPSSPGCDGCAQCSCRIAENKCVKSCPS
jgi:hypothetical protein